MGLLHNRGKRPQAAHLVCAHARVEAGVGLLPALTEHLAHIHQSAWLLAGRVVLHELRPLWRASTGERQREEQQSNTHSPSLAPRAATAQLNGLALALALCLSGCATTHRLEALEARVAAVEEVTGLGPKFDESTYSEAKPSHPKKRGTP
jgi:hypothetical protein